MPKLRLIKFTADWCGPCQDLEPVIEAVLEERPKLVYEKVNVDTAKGSKLADRYEVRSIPVLILERGDERLWRKVGYVGKRAILNAIDKCL